MNHSQHIGLLGLGGQLGLLPLMGSIVPYCAYVVPEISFAFSVYFARHISEIFCFSPRTPLPKKNFWENAKIAGTSKNMLNNIKNAKNMQKLSWGIHFPYFAYFAYFGYYNILIMNNI